MKRALLPVLLVGLLALTACGGTAEPVPTPTPTPTQAVNTEKADPDVVPVVLEAITADSVTAEGTRVADALATHLDAAVVTSIDDQSQMVPADGNTAAYYAAFRYYYVTAETDPAVLAQKLANVLEASGWSVYGTTNEGGVFIAALAIDAGADSWIGIVQSDATIDGKPTVAIQLASPDLPAE